MRKFFYLLSAFIIFVNTSFFCFGGDWEWTEGFFDVDEKYEGEEFDVIEDEKDFKSEVNNENFQKNFKEGSSSSDLPSLRSSAPSANYSVKPIDIPYFKLNEQGFSTQYEIICNILSGAEQNFTMLAVVTSDTNINLYICEQGLPFTYETYQSNTYNVVRFIYGYIGQVSSSKVPTFYALNYNFSTGEFSDRLAATQGSSSFGYNFNSSSVTSDYYYCYSIYTFTLNNFITNIRDYYFFGSPPVSSSLQGSLNGFLYLNRGDSTKVFHYTTPRVYSLGNSRSYFPSLSVLPDSGTRPYFFDTNFSLSDFQLEDIRTYDEDFSSSFDQSVQQFIDDTNDFITRINQSKARVTGYISDFFNVFDSDHIPRPLYFIILFLIICAVLVGVFT